MERPHLALVFLTLLGLVSICVAVAFFSVVLHPAVGGVLIVGAWFLIGGFRHPYLFFLLFIAVLLARPAEFFPILERLYPAKITAVLAMLTFFFYKMSTGDFSIVTSRHNPWMLALAAAALLSAVLGSSMSYGTAFYREVFLKIIVVYFLMVNLVRSPKQAMGYMMVAVVIGVILSVYALYRSYLGIGLVEGTRVALEGALADPNDLALVLILGAPFLLALTLEAGSKKRWISALLLFIVIAGVLSTQSRGGLLGLVAGSALVINNKIKNKAALVVVVGVVLIGLLALSGISSRQVGGQMNGVLDESAATRLSAWDAGLRMFAHRPVLGIGLNQFTNHYLNYAINPPVYEPYDAHNSYIKALAETGVVGFVPFMLLVWLTLKASWRLGRMSVAVRDRGSRALLASLLPTVVAVFAASFFLSHTWNWFFYILHALVAALLVVYRDEVELHEA